MTEVTVVDAGLEPTHVQALTDAADTLAAVIAAYERGVGDGLDAVDALSDEDVRLALLAAAALISDLRRDRGLPPMASQAPACGQEYPGSGGGCVMRPDHVGPCHGPDDVGSDPLEMPADPGRWADPGSRR